MKYRIVEYNDRGELWWQAQYQWCLIWRNYCYWLGGEFAIPKKFRSLQQAESYLKMQKGGFSKKIVKYE